MSVLAGVSADGSSLRRLFLFPLVRYRCLFSHVSAVGTMAGISRLTRHY